MLGSKTVLVIGTGTIGEPLIGLLCNFKAQLGIDDVVFHKRTPLMTDRSKVLNLLRRGARLATDENMVDRFAQMGLKAEFTFEEVLEKASVIIDCTPSGNDMKAKIYSKYEDNTDLFIAQGSEFGFGKQYARGINDEVLDTETDKYLQIVSCNTHNLSVLLKVFGGIAEDPANLIEGRFICMRRSNDISQDDSFVPSPQIGAHKDERFGTHHARDAWHLYKTKGEAYDLNVFSSAMKINTQLMHIIQYHLKVETPVTRDELMGRIIDDDRIATTYKTTANSVFSFGRDHGFCGRILNQSVIPTDSLHVSANGKEISGFCFTPQDGNSLLSSVAATVWGLYPETYDKIVQCLRPYFFQEV
jgi:glyceraldehyde-3-phosphate dehydrogenase/erythrose-4-phosphate dehydrogenase